MTDERKPLLYSTHDLDVVSKKSSTRVLTQRRVYSQLAMMRDEYEAELQRLRAALAAAPPAMTQEIRQALRSATRHWKRFRASNISHSVYSERDRETDDNIDAALQWLDAQKEATDVE